MNVSTSYYLKAIHGGHKVILENDKIIIAENTLSTKEFKATYGKTPKGYFMNRNME